jgi:hypothetical protein
MSTGYDKVAAFMATHKDMAIFERFEYMNTINLLTLQAEIKGYEEEIREALGVEEVSLDEYGVHQSDIDEQGIQGRQAMEMERNSSTPVFDDNRSGEVRQRQRVNRRSSIGTNHGSATENVRVTLTSKPCGMDSAYENNDEEYVLKGIDPRRDWYFLQTMESTNSVWETILVAREKLKEYSKSCHIQIFTFKFKYLINHHQTQ